MRHEDFEKFFVFFFCFKPFHSIYDFMLLNCDCSANIPGVTNNRTAIKKFPFTDTVDTLSSYRGPPRGEMECRIPISWYIKNRNQHNFCVSFRYMYSKPTELSRWCVYGRKNSEAKCLFGSILFRLSVDADDFYKSICRLFSVRCLYAHWIQNDFSLNFSFIKIFSFFKFNFKNEFEKIGISQSLI